MPTFTYTLGFSDEDSGVARSESQQINVQQLGFQSVYRMDVGTSEVTHSIITEIGNASYIWMMNRDATNFIDVGFIGTGVYEVRLLAGQHALFPLLPTTATLYLLADTAAVDFQFYIREA